MERYYEFAGVEVAISVPEQWMLKNEKALEVFRVTQVKNPHYFYFEIVDHMMPPIGELVAVFPDYRVYDNGEEHIRYIGGVEQTWKTAYIRIVHHENIHKVQLKKSKFINGFGAKTVLNVMEAEHLVIEKNGFILHASYIEYNGKAILFTAPSGTGKSTQADLWCKYRQARIINGDRVVIRMIDGKSFAVGIPFSGSSSYCEKDTIPLAAVVCLLQADEIKIQQINGIKAFSKIWEGCTVNTWNKDDLNKVVNIIHQLLVNVPVYELACTPDEGAVVALENELRKDR